MIFAPRLTAASCGDRAVGPDLQRETVIVGDLTDAHIVHRVVDLHHRRVNGIDGDLPDNSARILLVAVGLHIAPALVEGNAHKEAAVLAEACDMQVRVEDFNVGIGFDIRRRNFLFAGRLDVDDFGAVAVQFSDESFDIQNNFCDVLLDAGIVENSCETPSILDRLHRNARQGRQHNAPKGIPKGDAVTSFQRLHCELTILLVIRHEFYADLRPFDIYQRIFPLVTVSVVGLWPPPLTGALPNLRGYLE